MANSLGIVSSFLSCVQAVITSVLSFHVGIAFGQGFFFFFLPELVDRNCESVLEDCCQLAGVLASGVYAC